jgi:hypothetical protein
MERLLTLKQEFEKKYPRWIFKLEECTEDIKLQDKAVYLIVTGETEKEKQKTLEVSFFFLRTKVKDGFLNFRKEVKEFIKFVREVIDDFSFNSLSWNIDYGVETKEGSLRVAEIKATFDITGTATIEDGMMMNVLNLKFLGGKNG